MIRSGSKVPILNDQDGAISMVGTVLNVYKPGRCCVALPVGGFRSLKGSQPMEIIEREVKTKHQQQWRYETDDFIGTCIIAKDKMTIKFVFEGEGHEFYDVLKIDQLIKHGLQVPVSVEGMADLLAEAFPKMTVTAMGRAESHGWISATVKSTIA